MKRIATVLAGLAALLATQAPAAAHDDAEVDYGFTETTICVVRTDAAKGWKVGRAIRAWNAAQDYVTLSPVAVPGCGVIEIREVPGAPADDWNGMTDWPRWNEGAWDATHQRWSYHHAEVTLNHSSWFEARAPRQGCDRARVVAHEIGHALGLDHTADTESVMSPNHDWVKLCGAPSAGDVAILAALYG